MQISTEVNFVVIQVWPLKLVNTMATLRQTTKRFYDTWEWFSHMV